MKFPTMFNHQFFQIIWWWNCITSHVYGDFIKQWWNLLSIFLGFKLLIKFLDFCIHITTQTAPSIVTTDSELTSTTHAHAAQLQTSEYHLTYISKLPNTKKWQNKKQLAVSTVLVKHKKVNMTPLNNTHWFILFSWWQTCVITLHFLYQVNTNSLNSCFVAWCYKSYVRWFFISVIVLVWPWAIPIPVAAVSANVFFSIKGAFLLLYSITTYFSKLLIPLHFRSMRYFYHVKENIQEITIFGLCVRNDLQANLHITVNIGSIGWGTFLNVSLLGCWGIFLAIILANWGDWICTKQTRIHGCRLYEIWMEGERHTQPLCLRRNKLCGSQPYM